MEYGPVERAWILSSTRWANLRMYMYPQVIGLSYFSPVRPLYSSSLPLSPTRRSPSAPSGLIPPRISWIVGWSSDFSFSSQLAPSKTGVARNDAGLVFGRVLVSVPRIGSSPIWEPSAFFQPQRAQ